MSKVFPAPTVEMADMLSGNISYFKEWGEDALRGWVQWFVDKGRYLAVSSDGKLSGITLFRMVGSAEDCHEHYRDTGGDICYVEASVSRHPNGLRAMYDILWHGCGKDASKMAWVRHKHNNRLVMVDMKRAKRRFMR